MILDVIYFQSIRGEKGFFFLLSIQIIGFLSKKPNRVKFGDRILNH